ncbi:hypothetical protein Tco_1276871 [Tanacetum coccineum]
MKDKYPNQTVVIGRHLPTSFKKRLRDLLKANADIFTWTYSDMTGIPRIFMVGGRPFIIENQENKRRGDWHQKKRSTLQRSRRANKGEHPARIQVPDMGIKHCHDKKGNQIGQNFEVYVDDMVIKSDSEEDILADIQETFDKLRAINMKLNPIKCSFGVEEGPFLGYLITKQGIKANPSKVKETSDLEPPKMVKEIQSLNEKLASLSRFLPKGIDKTLPFLKVLKNYASKKIVQWTQDAEEAFRKMRRRIDKWAIELGEHDIEFRGRNSIKGQILADFLVEIPTTESKEKETQNARNEELDPENTWKLYTDGASSSDGSGAGLILVNPEGRERNEDRRSRHLRGLPTGSKPSEKTLRSKIANYKAILRENKIDSQKLQELLHGTCPARSEQESRCSKQASFHDLLKAR